VTTPLGPKPGSGYGTTSKLRRDFEHKAAKREGEHWRAYYQARHRLP